MRRLAVAKETAKSPYTRQVIDISLRSDAAAQAHMSRMREVEGSVATAFAERIGSSSKDEIEPRLLAIMTLSAMNVAVMAWHRGNFRELSAAVEQVFSVLLELSVTRKVLEFPRQMEPALSRKGPDANGPDATRREQTRARASGPGLFFLRGGGAQKPFAPARLALRTRLLEKQLK